MVPVVFLYHPCPDRQKCSALCWLILLITVLYAKQYLKLGAVRKKHLTALFCSKYIGYIISCCLLHAFTSAGSPPQQVLREEWVWISFCTLSLAMPPTHCKNGVVSAAGLLRCKTSAHRCACRGKPSNQARLWGCQAQHAATTQACCSFGRRQEW